MTIAYFLKDESAMLDFAAYVAPLITPGAVIFLKGELGAGKTTWVRGLMRALGYEGAVKSPSYTLVEPYELPQFELYHFDLYRIKELSEISSLGLNDYLRDDSVCVIEWPELIMPLIPAPFLECNIKVMDEGRLMQLNTTDKKLQHQLMGWKPHEI